MRARRQRYFSPLPEGERGESNPAPPPQPPPSLVPALFAVWLAGASAYWLLVAVRGCRFARLLRGHADPAPPDVLVVARGVADRLRLRRLPTVLFVEASVPPLVWAAVGRPRVVLPRRLWAGLTDRQREAVLAHELAHIARGDAWVRRLEVLVYGLYWWFPLAWLAGRRLRDAEEACCDAAVLAALPDCRAEYAEALVETVAFVSRPGWVPLASGGAARASALKRRVTMILTNSPAPRRRWAAIGVLALGLLALPLRPGLADGTPQQPEKAEPATPKRVEIEVRSDPPATTQQPRTTTAVSPAELQKLRDEVELLEVQLGGRSAQLRAVEKAFAVTQKHLDQMRQLARPGSAAATDVLNIEIAAAKHESELETKRAEVAELQVRLKQAKRRLAEAERPATAARPGPGESPVRTQSTTDRVMLNNLNEQLKQVSAEAAALEKRMELLAAMRADLAAKLDEVTKQQRMIDAQIQLVLKLKEQLRAKLPKDGPSAKP